MSRPAVLDPEILDLDVIDDPARARAALDPIRARILSLLGEPGSATTLAASLSLPRQQVNYHLRVLEDLGLVHLAEERRRRGLVERVMVASARSYAVSPAVLGTSGADPDRVDRLSTRYLVAVAARMVREVGELARRADRAGQALPTLTIDTEIRFASAADRAAFTAELADSVQRLAARYHDERAPRGRWHRLVVAAHPRLAPPPNPPTGSSASAPSQEETT
ncbi:MAG: helix-turn-helix domain-containing protein [Acidimicrobiales bacterium]|nr:helix-turn-helix domain-containing protein [Acidimicrobiales bacterium]